MHRSLRILVVLFVVALSAGTARAASFVIPHILEKSGTINQGAGYFDTQIEIAYPRGLTTGKIAAGTQVHLNLHLYNAAGDPLQSGTGQSVCNPCAFPSLGGAGQPRKISIRIDDLIMAKGGFASADELVTGFAVLVVDGDAKNAAIQAFVVNSITGPLQLSFLPLTTVPTK